MARDNGGPAFPGKQSADLEAVQLLRDTAGISYQDGKKLLSEHGGMSLRDWFAGQALAGLCGNAEEARAMRKISLAETLGIYADASYRIADAMLAERQKGGE